MVGLVGCFTPRERWRCARACDLVHAFLLNTGNLSTYNLPDQPDLYRNYPVFPMAILYNSWSGGPDQNPTNPTTKPDHACSQLGYKLDLLLLQARYLLRKVAMRPRPLVAPCPVALFTRLVLWPSEPPQPWPRG
jgi:hypothetical protein